MLVGVSRFESMLGEVLVDWLESERLRRLARAREVGMPATVVVRREKVVEVSDTGIRTDPVMVNVSPMGIDALAWQLSWPGEDEKLDELAAKVCEVYGDGAGIWNPIVTADADLRRREGVKQALHSTSREYLASLESLETPNTSLAKALAEDTEALFLADAITYVEALPVGGIKVPETTIESGGVRVRAITYEELGRRFEARARLPGWRPRRTLGEWPGMMHTGERVVVEVSTMSPKSAQPVGGRLSRVALALQLLGFELFGEGIASTWTEPGPSPPFALYPSVGLRRHPCPDAETKECSLPVLARAVSLAERIPSGAVSDPTKPREIVLHRFSLGSSEDSRLDALIDFVIALEGFLLGAKEGEYRFKFGLFGSWYLVGSPAERAAIGRTLREIYDLRSAAVHGAAFPSGGELLGLVRSARTLTAAMLVKALEEGWPSHDSLRDRVYG